MWNWPPLWELAPNQGPTPDLSPTYIIDIHQFTVFKALVYFMKKILTYSIAGRTQLDLSNNTSKMKATLCPFCFRINYFNLFITLIYYALMSFLSQNKLFKPQSHKFQHQSHKSILFQIRRLFVLKRCMTSNSQHKLADMRDLM